MLEVAVILFVVARILNSVWVARILPKTLAYAYPDFTKMQRFLASCEADLLFLFYKSLSCRGFYRSVNMGDQKRTPFPKLSVFRIVKEMSGFAIDFLLCFPNFLNSINFLYFPNSPDFLVTLKAPLYRVGGREGSRGPLKVIKILYNKAKRWKSDLFHLLDIF